MVHKRLLRPEALRRIPSQFSWIDQALVRDRHIERCDAQALALYLFLVTVGDAQGLSYYGEATLARSLSMAVSRLRQARADLIGAGLIAYERPLYQVLELDPSPPSAPRQAGVKSLDGTLNRLRAELTERRPPAKDPCA
jgi:hypothetical protein